MRLSEKQQLFATCAAQLLMFAVINRIRITLGDAYRDPRVHGEFGEKASYAATYSVHKLRLALDLNVHANGEYIFDGNHPHYRMLGEFWEKLHPFTQWGGRWGDASHFSFEHEGKA